MKRFLIFSDNHGINIYLKEVLDQIGTDFDGVVQLGDCQNAETEQEIRNIFTCPVYMVRGNCDGMSKLPAAALITLGGHKVFITHGHIYGARPSVPLMTDIAKENGADIVMYGHTHVPYLKKVFGVTVLNPGSISLPRQEDGKKSYAIMTVADDESVDFEICYHKE